jgi:hypothetical protein
VAEADHVAWIRTLSRASAPMCSRSNLSLQSFRSRSLPERSYGFEQLQTLISVDKTKPLKCVVYEGMRPLPRADHAAKSAEARHPSGQSATACCVNESISRGLSSPKGRTWVVLVQVGDCRALCDQFECLDQAGPEKDERAGRDV